MRRRSKSTTTGSKQPVASNRGEGNARNDSNPQTDRVASHGDDRAEQPVSEQPQWTSLQKLLSLFILAHFAALILAISSNLYQSVLQQRVIAFLGPYLVTTSQVYGAMPLEWTHAEPYDFPLELQVQTDDSTDWKRLLPGEDTIGISKSGRWLNLARILRLVLDDEPESEIVAELALAVLRKAMPPSSSKSAVLRFTAIRFVQTYVPSYSEAELMVEGLQDEVDTTPSIIYEAAVVYEGGQPVGLLPKLESYRSAKAIPETVEQFPRGPSDGTTKRSPSNGGSMP